MRYLSMLRPRFTIRFALLSWSALCLLGEVGCGSGGAVLPSDEVARTALESALKAWQGGGKPGALAGTEPPVEVHDTPWAQGAKLDSFEILQAESSGAEKKFAVRLALAKPAGVQEVQYYVLGRGPVMVFRDEDYMRNINMEDGPKLSKPGSQPRGRK
jgi:hypothetical protein